MRYIIGIDEVGRGSLAGPVTVAAVCVPKNLVFRNQNLGALRDSKKLTPLARERWLEYFKAHSKVSYAVARVYPRGIERMNIAKAANLAALRAYLRLVTGGKRQTARASVFLDGGLYVKNKIRSTAIGARTITRGDEKILAIKAASIVAKVTRDRAMVRLAKRYPRYGFAIHKGYGTKAHLRAVKRYGPSEAHRLTFLL